MRLLKPLRWATSPLDSETPWAWRGLVSAVVLGEGHGAPRDLIRDRAFPSWSSWTAGLLGYAMVGDGTNKVSGGTGPLAGTVARTSLTVMVSVDSGNNSGYFWGMGPTSSTNTAHWRWRLSDGVPRVEAHGGFREFVGTIDDGVPHVVIFRAAASSDINQTRCWVDGVEVGEFGSGAQAIDTDPVVYDLLGESGGLGPLENTTSLIAVLHWDRELSEAEISAMSLDPFAPFRAAPIVVRLATSAGLAAPTNLTATVQSESQIDLSWDSVTGATGYDIERDSVVIVEDHQSTSYSDTGLTSLQEYSYRVRSRKVS